MGGIFELRTDHCGLKYLFDHPTLNARQARWLEFLCEFDFKIKHIKGKKNMEMPSKYETLKISLLLSCCLSHKTANCCVAVALLLCAEMRRGAFYLYCFAT